MVNASTVIAAKLFGADRALAIGVIAHPSAACFSGATFAIAVDIPPVVKAAIVVKILLSEPVITAIANLVGRCKQIFEGFVAL